MQMHELQTTKKNRKRIGRGGKYRKTAGRGTKGQKSRSGGNVKPLFEGGRSSLVQRMKKLRGFTSIHKSQRAVSLSTLERTFKDGDVVSVDSLILAKVIRGSQRKGGAKIVATGKLTKKLTIAEDIATSQTAKELILKTGGKVEEVKEKKSEKE